jgi:hypothetical protein
MRSFVAGLVAVALAGAGVLLGPVPYAAADPAQDASIVVTANGGSVSTLFSTVPGVPYDVAVRGLYDHDGAHLADCGHRNTGEPGAAVDYVAVDNLFVNGSPAPCAGSPVAADHIYHWTITGTGSSVSFRLVAPAGAAGGLAVQVKSHTVTASCTFSVSGLPSSQNILVSITATATAEGGSDAAATTVRCAVRNSYGEEIVAGGPMPGAHAVFVGEGIVRASTLVPCITASAIWAIDVAMASYEDCP